MALLQDATDRLLLRFCCTGDPVAFSGVFDGTNEEPSRDGARLARVDLGAAGSTSALALDLPARAP